MICAVDDDALAPAVMETGAAVAERMGAPLVVVHCPHPDIYVTGEPRRLAIERGHEFVDRLTDDYDVDERIVEVGDPRQLITALSREGASMVVIGTSGKTGLRAAILGSVSHAVIAEAACPVVTVSEAAVERLEAAAA
ncbi:MAG TPA: universal stress protein [Solirubrobacter sp.]|nr:universal stress protein [Solirubrobacter sp.]